MRRLALAVTAWARGPVGRVVVPGLVAVSLLGIAGTAGAWLVPRTGAGGTAAPVTSSAPSVVRSSAPAPAASVPGLPGGSASAAPQPTVAGARPADALAGWAQQVGTRVGIPVVAVQAYGYAELVLARTTPGCRLSWTTLAALGKVESAHGRANNAVLGADGAVSPPIRGLPLDGQGGRRLIQDTDGGTLDGDTTYDRAVGPMQFIPTTWRESGVDADNDGTTDPNDIDDAALAAASYLCHGGRDLSTADAWWSAILSYNAVQPYAQSVFDAANDYGRRSRT